MKYLVTLIGLLTFSLQLNAQCAASMTASANPGTSDYTFTNQSSAGANALYILDTGDGMTYTLNSFMTTVNHTYTNPGTYIWCVSIYDSLTPCFDSYCDTITITNGTTQCDGYFSAMQQSAYVFDFNTAGNTTSGTVTHFWDFGDGNTSTNAMPTHTYSVNGTYTVCHTVSEVNGACTDTYCDSSVVVNGSTPLACQADFVWYEDSTQSATVIVYNNSTGNGPLTYFWDFGDGTVVSGAYPTHTYGNLGSYLVCLTITDNNGCTSTFCDTVSVFQKAVGFTINVIDGATASLDDFDLLGTNVYPNPVQHSMILEYENFDSNKSQYVLTNIRGQEVASNNIIDTQTVIDMNSLPSGVYFLNIDRVKTIRVIKQ